MIPYLNLIESFDALDDYLVQFTYLGSSRVLKNALRITESGSSSSSTIVYERETTRFDKNHTIPGGTLQNGKTYLASVRVEVNDEWSEWSPKVEFTCLAKPNLTFHSLDNENYVFNNDIMMQVLFRQEQGERVEKYQFYLLDRNKTLEVRYPVRLPDLASPNILQERINNLIKGRLYYVGIRVWTRSGVIYYEDKEFIPQYITPSLDSIVIAETQKDTGQVLIQSYLKQLLGTQVKPRDPNKEMINDVDYGYWKDDFIIIPKEKPLFYEKLGMAKASDWVAKVWCENVLNGTMLEFSKIADGYPHLKFIKYDDRIVCEKELDGIVSRTRSNIVPNLKLQNFYLYIRVIEFRVEMKIVPQYPSSIKLKQSSGIYGGAGSIKLQTTILPSNAMNKTVKYSVNKKY